MNRSLSFTPPADVTRLNVSERPAATGGGGRDPAPIVLDTNVCLDLLVFADPRVVPLGKALEEGHVIAIANRETREEWIRVLAYPALRLDIKRRAVLLEAFDDLVQCAGKPAAAGANALAATTLPRCGDPDDQKFLELARDASARWLLSRDRDLLLLAARCRRDGLFSILTPQSWADEFDGPSTT